MKRRSIFKVAACAIAFSAMECMGLQPILAPRISLNKRGWVAIMKNGTYMPIVSDIARIDHHLTSDGLDHTIERDAIIFENCDGSRQGFAWRDQLNALINPSGHRFEFDLSQIHKGNP